jgi:hypothetical protein
VVLLTLPFRYRHEINSAREAMPGRSRDAIQAAHYESVDERLSARPGFTFDPRSGAWQFCIHLIWHGSDTEAFELRCSQLRSVALPDCWLAGEQRGIC